MMKAEITDKDIEHAIDTCQWRLNVCGVYVCKGMCGACVRVIENGQCDTLQRLFRQYDKEHGYQGKMLTIEVGESE